MFTHTQTLIGQTLLSSLIPDAVLASGDKAIVSAAVSVDLHRCYSEALDATKSHERISCFVADTLTYLDAVRSFGKLAGRLQTSPEFPMPTFGLCFAMHPREGGRLGRLVNMGIAKLIEMNFFASVAYAPFGKLIKENHALVKEISSSHAAQIELEESSHAPFRLPMGKS
jgi:hypothetical protein